ncbi:hypothetical protein DSO57_1016323 [Entomophthora muscae]|uniref:Uncharacterized protein n=1 Tax=Entomophthora muscae TaxID=34485 RepID=A0ACC2STP2_9FUNG|nr:hypothetical protein DSO57_1016323 [Entomophthora muscae]
MMALLEVDSQSNETTVPSYKIINAMCLSKANSIAKKQRKQNKRLQTSQLKPALIERFINQIQALEKAYFAKSELTNIKDELSKPSVYCWAVLDIQASQLGSSNSSKAFKSIPVRNEGSSEPDVVGYLIFQLNKTSSSVHINKVCVHKLHWRKGIAHYLVSRLIYQLSSHPTPLSDPSARICFSDCFMFIGTSSCTKITLQVDPSNLKAYLLYTQLGFSLKASSIIDDYYGIGRPAHILTLEVS